MNTETTIQELIQSTAACWMYEFAERRVDPEWSREAYSNLSTAKQNRIGGWDTFHDQLQAAVDILYRQACKHG